jgi:hypothetical protein
MALPSDLEVLQGGVPIVLCQRSMDRFLGEASIIPYAADVMEVA